ncbi:hypothetical protein SAMN05421755_10585 [Nitrosomonas sp. Nm33]|nr:hypothetical protein SAMN05421755_10585 [Nitrosomonas sp. Nm33]
MIVSAYVPVQRVSLPQAPLCSLLGIILTNYSNYCLAICTSAAEKTAFSGMHNKAGQSNTYYLPIIG